jgi:hypothetical protein
MATFRREEEPVQAPGSAVVVPAELRVGALAEVWAEHAEPLDLGGAWSRYHRALAAWVAAEGLTVAQWSTATGPRSPWSLAAHDADGRSDDADDRLARAGLTRTDLPALRRAAGAYDINRRTTP